MLNNNPMYNFSPLAQLPGITWSVSFGAFHVIGFKVKSTIY